MDLHVADKTERYDNLIGLRGYTCLAIIIMHVLMNGDFGLAGFAYESLIPAFSSLTQLFMLISAFSLCCGYYPEFVAGAVDLEKFYKRRYMRVLPLFAFLSTVELALYHDINAVYEWLANLTLAFGFIPNHEIEVIGVGWFIGVVFIFYMIFPFFVFMLSNKTRAWIMMAVTVVLHILCDIRFTDAIGNKNFIYSSMFFAAGGMIYLYREKLKNKYVSIISLIGIVACCAAFYLGKFSDYVMLVLYSFLCILAISSENTVMKAIFQNGIIKCIGSISMELYLCHMVAYRVLEKTNTLKLFSNNMINYYIDCVVIIIGASMVIILVKKLLASLRRKSTQ